MTVENKVTDGAADVTPKDSSVTVTPEKKVPETVPYEKFAATNKEMKELAEKLKAYEDAEAKAKAEDLVSKQKYEEALTVAEKKYKEELDKFKAENFKLQKSTILSKYNIGDDLAEFVDGSTLEELEAKALKVSEKFSTKKVEDTKKDLPKNTKVEVKTDEKWNKVAPKLTWDFLRGLVTAWK